MIVVRLDKSASGNSALPGGPDGKQSESYAATQQFTSQLECSLASSGCIDGVVCSTQVQRLLDSIDGVVCSVQVVRMCK
ncbi:hypothetical protein PoB_000419500 [Plakobranchus ocellatus]|uniref:Late endosomal/lysosomal adaptor and MAPK and MTOR activator 5 n=1 Tax=Plakobranchus ocellatus TaxID=259542 RepID=A0AAV3Y3S6_9GAST|nr:hypothetical protein PoB_000419500 [Plakobranchus ocellatus]